MFLDWLFRRPSVGATIMRIGLGCLTLAFGAGWVLKVALPFRDGTIDLNLDSAGGTPALITYSTAVLGTILVCVGLAVAMLDRKSNSENKVIAVEGRGLRDTSGTPLLSAVPQSIEGKRESVLIDLRQRIRDGIITEPEVALQDLSHISRDIRQREAGVDRNLVTHVYGGLTPVPFTFLTGILLDDEGPILVMDWDRHAERWRALDGPDDGERFTVVGLDQIDGSDEVALIVSVSYTIAPQDVQTSLNNTPVVQLLLEECTPDNHWSQDKQQALGQQFLDTVIKLAGLGVHKVHAFIAAQNSVAFRLGRVYDKRNLPEIVVYQYQRGSEPPYQWGVSMPVAGKDAAAIVQL